MSKRFNVIFYSLIAVYFVFLFVFNANLDVRPPGDAPLGISYARCVAEKIISDTSGPDPDFGSVSIGVQEIEFRVLSGEFTGKTLAARNYVTRAANYPAKTGTKMVLASYNGFVTASVEGYCREPALLAVVLMFAFAVVILGGVKGVKALFSLIFTLVSVIFLFIPLIACGINPIAAASIMAVLSTAVTLFSLNGPGKKSLAAAVSCSLCTMFAGLFSLVAGLFAKISTFTTPEIENLLYISQRTPIRLHDLLFAGILTASLGAVMDTAMSVTSSIAEMKIIDPQLSAARLFKSGMNVGRDMIGTMTNTLILAFVGGGINLCVECYMYRMPLIRLLSQDWMAVQLIQGLSGSMGIVLAVPVSAFVAARMMGELSDALRKKSRSACRQ